MRSLFLFFSVLIFAIPSFASDWVDGMHVFEFVGIGESDSAVNVDECNPAEISISNKKAVVDIYDCDASNSPTKDCDRVVVMGEDGLDGWINSPAVEYFHRGYVRAFVRDIGEHGGTIAMQCYGVIDPAEGVNTTGSEAEANGN